MPRLDQRLKTVARQIQWPIHADIGSDHGHLLKALLAAGRIDRGIAIENKQQPFQNSLSTLEGLSADVRLADGFEGLAVGEADGVSICGMGGRSIVRILNAFPERVPRCVIVQPNRQPEQVRQWGINHGFHLTDEQFATSYADKPLAEESRREFIILRFVRQEDMDDPAYRGIDRNAAILFGPHFCKRNDPSARARLLAEKRYLRTLDGLSESMKKRIAAIDYLLSI